MRKIFFDSDTLEIKGMSDGEDSMDFPYIETEKNYHATKNLKIKKNGKKHELEIKQGTLKKDKGSIIKERTNKKAYKQIIKTN